MWSWFLWNLLRVLLWPNSWSTFSIFFPYVRKNVQKKMVCSVFWFLLSHYILYLAKIWKVQLINSRCINICTYVCVHMLHMHTYSIHQHLSPAATCGALRHQWPRISVVKGEIITVSEHFGEEPGAELEIFPPPWSLSAPAAAITQARITKYSHSHIKTGLGYSFQIFLLFSILSL